MARELTTLTDLARLGFAELDRATALLDELAPVSEVERILPLFALAADPDQALWSIVSLTRQAPEAVRAVLADDARSTRLIRVLGASAGLADFFLRLPDQLHSLDDPLDRPLSPEQYRADLLEAVAGIEPETLAWSALRVRYRHHLARLTAFDLEQRDPVGGLHLVAAALADLASAALEASLAVARRSVAFPASEVSATRLAIIGMGKAGARELNYVSDVDVIFVADADGIESGHAVEIATRLAIGTMRGITELTLRTVTKSSMWCRRIATSRRLSQRRPAVSGHVRASHTPPEKADD